MREILTYDMIEGRMEKFISCYSKMSHGKPHSHSQGDQRSLNLKCFSQEHFSMMKSQQWGEFHLNPLTRHHGGEGFQMPTMTFSD